jgi:hypothetical protein
MAAASSVQLPSLSGPKAGASRDPKIGRLERTLAYFEARDDSAASKAKDSKLSAINNKLNSIDQTVAKLKATAEAQRKLTKKLAREYARRYPETSIPAVAKAPAVLGLPKDFEASISKIIGTVKDGAERIYGRACGGRKYCPVKIGKKNNKKHNKKGAKKNARKPNPPPQHKRVTDLTDSELEAEHRTLTDGKPAPKRVVA